MLVKKIALCGMMLAICVHTHGMTWEQKERIVFGFVDKHTAEQLLILKTISLHGEDVDRFVAWFEYSSIIEEQSSSALLHHLAVKPARHFTSQSLALAQQNSTTVLVKQPQHIELEPSTELTNRLTRELALVMRFIANDSILIQKKERWQVGREVDEMFFELQRHQEENDLFCGAGY